MDTTNLKIKFTPLFQKAYRNSSKCCLEILPEVSYIENLDKLTWRQESNLIEYSIPMTYKIILRKQHVFDNSSENMIKTYHSCVDLLLSSLQSNSELGSRDVSKIISDTLIPSLATKEPIENPAKHDHETVNRMQTAREKLETLNSSVNEVKEICINKDSVKVNTTQKKAVNVVKELRDTPTNTETVFPLYMNDAFKNLINVANNHESKRKLIVSPICSVNAEDTKVSRNSGIISKPVPIKECNPQKDVQLIRYTNVNGFSNENQPSSIFNSPLDNAWEQNSIKSIHYFASDKCPPEIRVAHYLQCIKTELFPLNKALDEILSKCSLLGMKISKHTTPSNCNLMLCQSASMYKRKSKLEICDTMVSNRAVYSIVFDE